MAAAIRGELDRRQRIRLGNGRDHTSQPFEGLGNTDTSGTNKNSERKVRPRRSGQRIQIGSCGRHGWGRDTGHDLPPLTLAEIGLQTIDGQQQNKDIINMTTQSQWRPHSRTAPAW